MRAAAQAAPSDPGFLRVSGKYIVDGQGRNVLLRGIGLGNWMLQEPYMMEVTGIVDNQQQLKAKIAELVGAERMEQFYEAWWNQAFGSADVQAMARAGMNSIRLPMHYALLTPPADQEPVAGMSTWLEPGFKLIDDLLGWCEANRIYLILDMHACPGGQGHDRPISDYNPPAPSLWESEANRHKLIALWREIARRYVKKPWIGGYDLINEPNWTFENRANKNGCEDQTNAPLRQLLMDLTAAVREVDTNHIIFLAGNCWGGNYNGILPPWDPNLVISFHKYWDPPTTDSLQSWVKRRDQWNMPIWLGESGENSNEWFRDVIRLCEAHNIGWAWWPWKKVGSIAGPVSIRKPEGYQRILDYWRNRGPKPSADDAFAALMQLAEASRFENCFVRPDVLDAMMRPEAGNRTLPYAAHRLPGRVYAVHYDMGRAGEAFFDTTTSKPHNSGQALRNDSVDIQTCTDDPSGTTFNVGWTAPGEWLKYTLAQEVVGVFSVSARVASEGGGEFHLEADGQKIGEPIKVPATSGWESWSTVAGGTMNLSTPAKTLKVVIDSGSVNLYWFDFKPVP